MYAEKRKGEVAFATAEGFMLKDVLKTVRYRLSEDRVTSDVAMKPDIPDDLWFKCDVCGTVIYTEDFEKNLYTCEKCGYHKRIGAAERIDFTVDADSFVEFDEKMKSKNPIGFPEYEEKYKKNVKKTGLNEAIITGKCTIDGMPCCIAAMDSGFIMGSMGSVVGEKIARLFEYATAHKLPVIIFTTSGGARMQEGILSLMQMAKTSAAIALHNEAGLLYITVLTDPTTGGVTASFASLGDIILAEPKALIGFAGKRVIEGTIRQKLPDGFQTSEFFQEHGFVDAVVHRKTMKATLGRFLRLHQRGEECE